MEGLADRDDVRDGYPSRVVLQPLEIEYQSVGKRWDQRMEMCLVRRILTVLSKCAERWEHQ